MHWQESSRHNGSRTNQRILAIGSLTLIVLAIYFTRIDALPVSGEEGRWARGAVQMMESGDWIVPRQQGEVFPERPPLSSWAMAIVGMFRGEVDTIAIRLPSVLAVLLTALLVFFYAGKYLSPFGAFAAGAIYATFGQVMEIGRMGESESLFTLLVAASLLLWHHGYRHWRPLTTWSVGYAMMALAALVKGPQAPVYFIAVTFLYLAMRGDWKFLFRRAHLAGIGLAILIVGAWQVPFYFATDMDAVIATWAGLAGDRFTIGGLVHHATTYPLETLGCLLPWSPLLFVCLRRDFRLSIASQPALTELVRFITVAIAITYPTVWFASGARGRYYMPLYPLIAILLALVVDRCAEAVQDTLGRKIWNPFATVVSLAMVVMGVVIAFVSVTAFDLGDLTRLRQPMAMAAAFALIAISSASVVRWSLKRNSHQSTAIGFVVICLFFGGLWTGVVLNVQRNQWNDVGVGVAKVKSILPPESRLVSFAPADHRFCYFYREAIPQLAWPASASEVPPDIEYFCINHNRDDTTELRRSGRGRISTITTAKLPFQWEEVARVSCDRKKRESPAVEVIVGRIVRPTTLSADDVVSALEEPSNSVEVVGLAGEPRREGRP